MPVQCLPLALLSAFISEKGGSCPKVLSPKSSVGWSLMGERSQRGQRAPHALPTWGRGAAQAPPALSSWAELGSEAGGGSGTPRRS